MPRPSPVHFFLQSLKSEALYADEIVNVFLLRPLAAAIVWLLYPTRITPNQVTMFAIAVGCCAAAVYLVGDPGAIAVAGILALMKDILDDADGQLARAKEQYSRRGRFIDSIGDFIVDVAIFSAITAVVYRQTQSPFTIVLGVASFFGTTLRVSYHVFYQASFLHLQDKYKLNRIIEEVTDEDRKGDPIALKLQIVFNSLYMWQDRLMSAIDRWSARDLPRNDQGERWYGDLIGLRISGLLGFGTEFIVLMVCSLSNWLHGYLYVNVLAFNAVWLASIAYRRYVLSLRIPRMGGGSGTSGNER